MIFMTFLCAQQNLITQENDCNQLIQCIIIRDQTIYTNYENGQIHDILCVYKQFEY